jgi:type IV pilus assembly protein PilB
VILVGEIRDRETGVTAAEAAVTGHLLLSTLHTNDAASAIHRLLEMGVPALLVAPSVNVVVAQRLMRRVCRHCAERYTLDPELVRELLPDLRARDLTLVRGGGCLECDDTGYRGRAPIHEVLVIDEDLRMAISKGASTAEIKNMAIAAGMRDLKSAALERVFAGETPRRASPSGADLSPATRPQSDRSRQANAAEPLRWRR